VLARLAEEVPRVRKRRPAMSREELFDLRLNDLLLVSFTCLWLPNGRSPLVFWARASGAKKTRQNRMKQNNFASLPAWVALFLLSVFRRGNKSG